MTPLEQGSEDDVARLRKEAGFWLKGLREEAGLSQRALAREIGLEYYTFISQLEAGRGRVPPAQMPAFARALKVAPARFAKELMRYYDPVSYAMIFSGGPDQASEASRVLDEIERGVKRLRSLF